MRTSIQTVLAALMVAAAVAEARPATKPSGLPGGVQKEANVVFAKVGDVSLKLDLYRPTNAPRQLPLIIWVHGGGWQGGTKDNCPAVTLVSRGYAVASIEYRLSQTAVFPAQIEDVRAAVRYLRANAGTLGLDPNRFVAWGASAGGHLVSLLGTTPERVDWDTVGDNRETSAKVSAVCDWFGPSDFGGLLRYYSMADSRFGDDLNNPLAKLLGGSLKAKHDLAEDASPMTHVSADAPPFLVMHGGVDLLVPIGQSTLFVSALKRVGVTAELKVFPKLGHTFLGAESVIQVGDFFDRVLKSSTTQPATTR